MRREDTKYWRRNGEGRLVYVPVVWERSPEYLTRKMRHEKREKAVEELFNLVDELIFCKCRTRNKKDCKTCVAVLVQLKAAVAEKPWRIKRDSLFAPPEAPWTTVYIIED
jgi:hypothetical protein